jgi:MFS family permease
VADDLAATTAERPSALQPWMLANVAMGAGFSAFIALLIPPYVTEVTSDASAAGVVMALISLAAILGPVLGTFADRHAAHRLVMSGGVLGLAIGFAAFAFASKSAEFFAIDAIILGVSVAAVSAVGPVFIVGLGLSRDPLDGRTRHDSGSLRVAACSWPSPPGSRARPPRNSSTV